jgi:Rho family protein
VKLVLVALKCDLRENSEEEAEEGFGEGENSEGRKEQSFINYNQGLEVARRIQALRYLGRKRLTALDGAFSC